MSKRRKRPAESQLTIVVTYTGDVVAAYDAARRVLDGGALQDAMAEQDGAFSITNVEVK